MAALWHRGVVRLLACLVAALFFRTHSAAAAAPSLSGELVGAPGEGTSAHCKSPASNGVASVACSSSSSSNAEDADVDLAEVMSTSLLQLGQVTKSRSSQAAGSGQSTLDLDAASGNVSDTAAAFTLAAASAEELERPESITTAAASKPVLVPEVEQHGTERPQPSATPPQAGDLPTRSVGEWLTPQAGKGMLGLLFLVTILVFGCRDDSDGLDLFPEAKKQKLIRALRPAVNSDPAAADQELVVFQLPSLCHGLSRASRLAVPTAVLSRPGEDWAASIVGPDLQSRLRAARKCGPQGEGVLELHVEGPDGQPEVIATAEVLERPDLARCLQILGKDGHPLGHLEVEKGGGGFVFKSPEGGALARLGSDPEGNCLEMSSSLSGERLATATPRAAGAMQAATGGVAPRVDVPPGTNAAGPTPILLEEDHLDVSAERGIDAAFVLVCALGVTLFDLRAGTE